MSFYTLEEAQGRLRELIEKMIPGEELFLTDNEHTIARIVRMPLPRTTPRVPGSAKGILTIVEDDDSHLEDFKEYM